MAKSKCPRRRTTLTEFTPINDDHAVTSVTFALRLDEFIEPAVLEAAQGAKWRAALPAMSSLPAIEISGMEIPAVQFAIVRPDARPLWALKLNGYELSIECTAYTRWAEVWGHARQILEEAWHLIRSHQSDAGVIEFRLQVVDQFKIADNEYDLSGLFNDNGTLSAVPFKGSPIWHSNIGWFDQVEDLGWLNALGAQATTSHAKDGRPVGPFKFTVNHLQRASIGGAAVQSIDRMDEIVCKFHENNKAQLVNILNPEIAKRIGLTA